MASPFFGEFMGTAVLILLGNGVVANVLLKKSKGEGGDGSSSVRVGIRRIVRLYSRRSPAAVATRT